MARSSFRCVTFHFGRSCETQTKGKKHFERIFLHCNLIQPVHSVAESFGIGNNTIAPWIQCNEHVLCMYLGFQTLIDSVWLVVSHHYYPFTMYRKIDGNESHCFIWLCYYTPYWSDGGTEWIFLKKKNHTLFERSPLIQNVLIFGEEFETFIIHCFFFIVKANFYINCNNLWHFNGQKFINWTLCDHTSHTHRHIYYAKTNSITIRKK